MYELKIPYMVSAYLRTMLKNCSQTPDEIFYLLPASCGKEKNAVFWFHPFFNRMHKDHCK